MAEPEGEDWDYAQFRQNGHWQRLWTYGASAGRAQCWTSGFSAGPGRGSSSADERYRETWTASAWRHHPSPPWWSTSKDDYYASHHILKSNTTDLQTPTEFDSEMGSSSRQSETRKVAQDVADLGMLSSSDDELEIISPEDHTSAIMENAQSAINCHLWPGCCNPPGAPLRDSWVPPQIQLCSRCERPSHPRCAGEDGTKVVNLKSFVCPFCRLRHMDPFAPVQAPSPNTSHGLLAFASVAIGQKRAVLKFQGPTSVGTHEGMAVQVRAIAIEPSPTHEGWLLWGPRWPHSVVGFVNGAQTFAVKQGTRRLEEVYTITSHTKAGENTIELQVGWSPKKKLQCGKPGFLVGVLLVRHLKEDASFLSEYRLDTQVSESAERKEHEWTLGDEVRSVSAGWARVMALFQEQVETHDDVQILNCESICAQRRVKLMCPLSGSRIEKAAVGKWCRHLQCFDLHSYIRITRKQRSLRNRWQCPVCALPTRPEALTLDLYTQNILNQTVWQENRPVSDEDEVIFDVSGNWTPVFHEPDCHTDLGDTEVPVVKEHVDGELRMHEGAREKGEESRFQVCGGRRRLKGKRELTKRRSHNQANIGYSSRVSPKSRLGKWAKLAQNILVARGGRNQKGYRIADTGASCLGLSHVMCF